MQIIIFVYKNLYRDFTCNSSLFFKTILELIIAMEVKDITKSFITFLDLKPQLYFHQHLIDFIYFKIFILPFQTTRIINGYEFLDVDCSDITMQHMCIAK